jgi:chromosome segregation ATPase
VKDLRDLNAAMAEKEAEKKKYIEQANAKSNSIQGSIDSTMELLDGLKTDVANLNGELNEKRAAEAGLTEKTETDDQKIDIMKQTQAEKEAMVSQLEAAGVENTEQIAELEEASTQLAAELDEVLKTIEESRAKIDKYTAERAGQKSAVPPNLKKK